MPHLRGRFVLEVKCGMLGVLSMRLTIWRSGGMRGIRYGHLLCVVSHSMKEVQGMHLTDPTFNLAALKHNIVSPFGLSA